MPGRLRIFGFWGIFYFPSSNPPVSANLLLPLYIRFYVDALNFYYGVAREYGIKWIDMEKLLISLVREKIPNAEVEKIFIFTSMVKGFPPEKQKRQQTYLNALKAHSPSIEIMYGDFAPDNRSVKNIEVPIDTEREEGWRTSVKGHLNIERVEIRKWEEKQTDVNLACRIIEDAHTEEANLFDVCCLVSGDSDFLYPLKAKRRLKQRVFFIAPIAELPESRPVHQDLKRHTEHKDRILTISKKLVRSCQLPDEVGEFTKPAAWASASA